ncbi:MAG: 30S ribosomal protein S20 [Ignavibacteriales bacterium]|nr:30S ribosomal protein S20 [Ignavibacteriales bacterium]
MARHKSAIRQHRRSLRRKAVNTQVKSALRTQMRKMREAIAEKDREAAVKLLPAARQGHRHVGQEGRPSRRTRAAATNRG